jgi:Domain of unknown function (DU1801)
VVEEVKWKKPSRPEGVPVWSLGGIVYIGEMLKSAVRLRFPKGARMKDPEKLFNARLDSNSVRAIDFFEGEKVPEAALRARPVIGSSPRTPKLCRRWCLSCIAEFFDVDQVTLSRVEAVPSARRAFAPGDRPAPHS